MITPIDITPIAITSYPCYMIAVYKIGVATPVESHVALDADKRDTSLAELIEHYIEESLLDLSAAYSIYQYHVTYSNSERRELYNLLTQPLQIHRGTYS